MIDPDFFKHVCKDLLTKIFCDVNLIIRRNRNSDSFAVKCRSQDIFSMAGAVHPSSDCRPGNFLR